MGMTAEQLPEDVAADLADLRAAIARGEAEEKKQPGQPRTVHGPRGLRWFPNATERGVTLRSFLVSTAAGLSFLGLIVTAVSFAKEHPYRIMILGATAALILMTTVMAVLESRREARARAAVALGTFLLGDALVVIDRGQHWALRRHEIRRVGYLRGTQSGEVGDHVRHLAVQHDTPDGPRWLAIGWRYDHGAKALVEAWLQR